MSKPTCATCPFCDTANVKHRSPRSPVDPQLEGLCREGPMDGLKEEGWDRVLLAEDWCGKHPLVNIDALAERMSEAIRMGDLQEDGDTPEGQEPTEPSLPGSITAQILDSLGRVPRSALHLEALVGQWDVGKESLTLFPSNPSEMRKLEAAWRSFQRVVDSERRNPATQIPLPSEIWNLLFAIAGQWSGSGIDVEPGRAHTGSWVTIVQSLHTTYAGAEGLRRDLEGLVRKVREVQEAKNLATPESDEA